MRNSPFLAACLVAVAAPALIASSGARAQDPCGSSTTLAAGETLADVAERCGTTVEALRDANPDLPAGAIPAGTEIDMPGVSGGDLLGRARDAVREAGEQVEGAARRAGRSVSDYLTENPDLSRDILEFGERLGLPGVQAPDPEVGADLIVSPASGAPGDEVTIRASGLRGEADAVIGAGPPSAEYEILERTTTTASGRVEARLAIPQWAAGHDSLVFVVETDRVRLTSEPFEVQGR